MREIIRYGLILGLVCFLAGGLLAVVNGITAPKIQLQKEKEEDFALRQVIYGAVMFKEKLENGRLNYYVAYDSANRLKGFVVKSQGRGYSSDIEVLTGLDLNLEITDIKILYQNETPGLGNRISEPGFCGQFRGKNLGSLHQIQAITGASISSEAVINSIKDRVSALKPNLLKDIQYAR
ncbi:MAG: FMN-binding protein [Candidatus Omnitrophica bacterium]|nr:FMN-binding protein [Candidatus Omnitrophota bacterium]MBU4473539.1 FMN-binding protein [Candidatus Omnitrophota bacterium]MCG2706692.1 FMN-binding protein [Candidatus Omnitrophota bacterium]